MVKTIKTMATTEENNRLIDLFMAEFEEHESDKLTIINDLVNKGAEPQNYHEHWDLIMPVVEKIEDFYDFNGLSLEFQMVTYEDEVKIILKWPMKKWEIIVEISADGSGKKANIYKAVVQFIKWYNENK